MAFCLFSMIFPTINIAAVDIAWGEPFLAIISFEIAYTSNRPQIIFLEFIARKYNETKTALQTQCVYGEERNTRYTP